MDNYEMIFAGMLIMALVGGLITFLIIRPWTRPMRRDWEVSHEVVAENSRLAAAQVRRQTAEEQDMAIRAAIAAEETRSRFIEAQAGNDQLEIERRAALRRARIDPDEPPPCQQPKSWLHKHWFLSFVGVIILIIILSKLNLI